MAECCIKKYDELPARVGTIDVDMLRWVLNKRIIQENKPQTIFNKVLWFFTTPSMSKERCISCLEKARMEHIRKNQKPYKYV